MKFLMINGASTSGKSTVVAAVLKEKGNYFKLSYDALKRLFSKYEPARDYGKVTELKLELAEIVFKKKYNVVCDGGLYKERREKMLDMARAAGYEVIEVNLEAEFEVLEERFDARLKNSVNAIVKPTNLSKDRFKELYDIYHAEKNPNATTFRTDQLAESEVIEKILNLL
jgi:predicted kinase